MKSVVQVPLNDEERAKLEAKPDRLAIGKAGGFQVCPVMRRCQSVPSTESHILIPSLFYKLWG